MSIEAMKQALEALDAGPNAYLLMNTGGIANKLRQAIAELEKQQPVAWRYRFGDVWVNSPQWNGSAEPDECQPLYTHPQPKREWVGLTDEERQEVYDEAPAIEGVHFIPHGFAIAIEAKLKEKNT